MVQPDAPELAVSVSEFVALLNQTLEFAYPSIIINGELANFRVSKNRWIYFDLKDELATVRFFGTVYQLPGPLENGMLLRVRGAPRLHQLYGFSVNVQTIQPAGEGAIRRAADLLQAKLEREGLFDESRKRTLPYPPQRIGLITSKESAAYADFTKIINARWRGVDIQLIDVQVQGEAAPTQIEQAIQYFNQLAEPPEVLVVTRGGGSAEDLQAFSTENVTRAVAASRVPTLVAIGHEIDLSLAELAADRRASTPSNAAEMLVPDRQQILSALSEMRQQLGRSLAIKIQALRSSLKQDATGLSQAAVAQVMAHRHQLTVQAQLLKVLSPEAVLRRGYAIVRKNCQIVRSAQAVQAGDIVEVQLAQDYLAAKVIDTDDQTGGENG